jgi:hypothetical protein
MNACSKAFSTMQHVKGVEDLKSPKGVTVAPNKGKKLSKRRLESDKKLANPPP